jgi:hypothetical protein
VLVTHDTSTFPPALAHRFEAGLPVPRTILVPQSMAHGAAIVQILLLVVAGTELDWEARAIRLPLR